MSLNIKNLLKLSSQRVAETLSAETVFADNVFTTRPGRELAELLKERNGFYAFESALLVRPLSFSFNPLGLLQWNADQLWRHAFESDFSSVMFFAEDIFGVQFCIKRNEICSFDPETGEFQSITSTLHEWAGWILEDYPLRTAWPLAHEWQQRYGAIEKGQRLLPRKPFVLGGQFLLENLYKLNDVDGMLFRASVAVQLRNCPDGTNVILRPQGDGSER